MKNENKNSKEKIHSTKDIWHEKQKFSDMNPMILKIISKWCVKRYFTTLNSQPRNFRQVREWQLFK